MGGVARQIVCDNLKAGVTAASRYEPGISRTYQDMATHYGTAILPARVRKPRDKAKVEVGVQVVQRWVLARLRHRRFHSLAELNGAIRELVTDLNDRPMRHLGTSRRALFEAMERQALLPMPDTSYAYAEWRRCRAGLDYHVEVHGHFYSVPYRLVREVIEARITDQTIELFHKGDRVACHVRNPRQHRHTTIPEHMPSAHRRHAEWTPTRLLREAEAIGPSTIALVERILAAKPHPEQGFRACLGILRLVRSYGPERLEAACQRGMDIGARTYGSVQSILRNRTAIPRSDVGNADRGLDRAYRPEPVPDELPVQHENIRGSGYYH
jgi:transposase